MGFIRRQVFDISTRSHEIEFVFGEDLIVTI